MLGGIHGYAIQLALHAIMLGLFHSDAISADQVRAVGAALKDAAEAAKDWGTADSVQELLALAKDIKTDTAVI
jgi:hypothetical protein